MTKLLDCRNSSHRALSAAVLLELKALGDKYGVDFSVDGGTIGDTDGMMRLKFRLQDLAGKKTQDQRDWELYCRHYGFEPTDFNRTFVSNRELYKITGLAPTRPRFPISAVRVKDNRPFKFNDSTVRAAMPKKVAA